jgi:hypothetical protein
MPKIVPNLTMQNALVRRKTCSAVIVTLRLNPRFWRACRSTSIPGVKHEQYQRNEEAEENQVTGCLDPGLLEIVRRLGHDH